MALSLFWESELIAHPPRGFVKSTIPLINTMKLTHGYYLDAKERSIIARAARIVRSYGWKPNIPAMVLDRYGFNLKSPLSTLTN
jgi:hypothetical protein